MIAVVMVALGSGLGALSRYFLSHWLQARELSRTVAATLAVNLSGCLAAGLLAGFLDSSGALAWSLLMTGFLGSYTTVSSFSLETLGLWQSERRGMAAAYLLASLIGGLALAGAGLAIAGGSGT